MAAPVWTLSVDLQTKTATFVSGLSDAAKHARGTFQDIKQSASDASEGVTGGTTNMRAALGLFDNTIRGNHAAAMADLIREFQHTSVVMSAIPYAATAGGILLLASLLVEIAKKVKEWREEQQKLTDDQLKFATAVDNAYKTLDEKILQSGIRMDDLRNNHLGALHKQLELIDKQSMGELVQQFGLVGKAADEVFGELQGHWYSMGIGSEGAKHALDEFTIKYNALLAQGKDKEASDLLAGTRQSAQAVLEAMTFVKNNAPTASTGGAWTPDAKTTQYYKDAAALKAAGVGYTEKEVQAQQTLVNALRAQETIESRVSQLKNLDKGNATTATGKEFASLGAEAARQAADHRLRMGELEVAAEREKQNSLLTISDAGIQERLASDLALADKERDIQIRGNADQIAALDKGGKDYQNQLKALQDKALEIEEQHANAAAGLRDKANVEQYRKDVTDLQQSEREKIEATDQGSAERLAAIGAAIREEESKNLQLTAFYRELLTMRASTQRAAQSEEDRLRADAGKEAAAHTAQLGQIALAAEREQQALQDSARRMTDQMRMAEALKVAQEEYQIKEAALKQQIDALDKSGKDYENKLKALQDKQIELAREHENELTQIRDQAQMARNTRILQGEEHLQDALASGMARTLLGHQSFGAMILSIGDQIGTGMIQNAIKSILANDMTKESDAAAAARKAFLAGMHFPFPANIVMAPVLGAAAFASVMAFAGGTDGVPGVSRGDTIPAMLTPGEGVVPGGVMDGLGKVARSGGFDGGGPRIHAPVTFAPTIHAIDATGVDAMLEKHGDKFHRKFVQTLRKQNR